MPFLFMQVMRRICAPPACMELLTRINGAGIGLRGTHWALVPLPGLLPDSSDPCTHRCIGQPWASNLADAGLYWGDATLWGRSPAGVTC
jgi:hypothetical protein